MPRQLELLPAPELKLRTQGSQTEPRLWIRRIAIWSEPGTLIRNVKLRPGLNIVWSPDPADDGDAGTNNGLGHGSGKTLFCRLLRYCLGEETFAPESEKDAIAIAFPRGVVGCEVVVNGTTWAVVRPLGMVKRSAAVAGGDLDALALNTPDAAGVEPLLDAIETTVLSAEVAGLLPGERLHRAWPLALAWLGRDQECRFDHVLEWRDSTSDSGSPARSLSASKALDVVRALMRAINPKERPVRAQIASLEQKRTELAGEAGHRAWEARQLRKRIVEALGLDEAKLPYESLAIEVFRQAAGEQAGRVVGGSVRPLDDLGADYESARARSTEVLKALAEVEAQIPVQEKLLRSLKGEIPGLGMAVHKAEHPICPVCEVPIDRVLAEGCKLSHKVPDLDAIKAQREALLAEIQTESTRLEHDQHEKSRLAKEAAVARRRADELHGQLQARLKVQADREEASFSAKQLLHDIDRLHRLLLTNEQADGELQRLADEIERERERAAAYRDEQADVFRHASGIFDAVVRCLVGPRASGRVDLDGNGLHLRVDLGGDRSTAAIDSLKVLAFDITAMCMSMEGATHLPAFLVHDSPREADLGLSAYHRLFHFVNSLEGVGKAPLFQYIVTTTTSPPDEFRKEPWLVLRLGGEPAEERLLRKDL